MQTNNHPMLIEHLSLDEELYRKITAMSYSEHISVQKLINDMLKEYLNVYVLSKKIGYALISKDVLKTTFDNTPEDKVMELSRKVATRYREAAILLHGKPSQEEYICLIKSFVTANGYYIEFSKHAMVEQAQEDGQSNQDLQQQKLEKSSDLYDVMIIRFNISYKFSQFLGNVYRILLEEFCTVKQFELTETLVFYEYKKK
ncbi:MAG TPA: hypothetical protein VI278_10260 [Nitrososphaeraceae archaeon]